MSLDKLKQRHATVEARMTELVVGSRAESRTMTPAETAEYETCDAERESLAATIAVEERESIRAELATLEPVQQRGPLARARVVAAGPAILTKTTQAQRNGDRFQGETYTAFICARVRQVANNVDLSTAIARHVRAGRPELAKVFRDLAGEGAGRFRGANEIAGGGTGSGDWGHELVSTSPYVGDFIEFLREKTVFDRLPLRTIPANVTVKGQDGTGIAYWVGEHKSIPMSAQDYSSVNLAPLKIGALTAISIELAEDGSPDALQLVAESLRRDSTQLLDSRFLSATAASAGVSPAGILNGLSAVGSSAGTDLNGLIADQDALVQPFITAKNTGGLAYVARPSLAHKIGQFRNMMGMPIYPGLTEEGGTLDGKPFYTSDNAGSGDLLLLKPSDIYKIGDSGLSLDVSREATLEMASDPTGAGDATPVAASKQPVSLFQAGMIGVRLMRRINWAKRRSGAVTWIDDAAYVPQLATS